MKRTHIERYVVSMGLAISLLLQACSDDEPSAKKNDAPCVITSGPSYFGTTQTFEYGADGNLSTRKYEFGYPGYGPFTQTVDATKTYYTYTSSAGVVAITDIFIGGTGNLYDGVPERMVRLNPPLEPDTLLGFEYDDRKRLSVVTYYHRLLTYDITVTYSRQLYSTELRLTYDNNDNVVTLEQTLIYREGVYVVNKPSDSYFVFPQSEYSKINVTYDSNPSPYSAVLKYWKFVQGDWGYAINSNWQAIISSLSKNNPLTISFEMMQGNPVEITNTITYQYNEHGFPVEGYTYTCQ